MRPTKSIILLLLLFATAEPLQGDKKRGASDQDLVNLFETRLDRTQAPTVQYMLERAQLHALRNTSKDQVWNALIKVLMQNGLIVHAQKQSGLMVAVTNLVTRAPGQGPAGLLGDGMPLSNSLNLYVSEADSGLVNVYLKSDKPVNRVLFDKLTIQLEAKKRWQYLSIGNP